jgi:hypothetical protein
MAPAATSEAPVAAAATGATTAATGPVETGGELGVAVTLGVGAPELASVDCPIAVPFVSVEPIAVVGASLPDSICGPMVDALALDEATGLGVSVDSTDAPASS